MAFFGIAAGAVAVFQPSNTNSRNLSTGIPACASASKRRLNLQRRIIINKLPLGIEIDRRYYEIMIQGIVLWPMNHGLMAITKLESSQ